MNEFKKGDYVVLLSSCDGGNCWSNIPINHVYRLKEDSNDINFYMEKNLKGSTEDGWSVTLSQHPKYVSKLKLRLAYGYEIKEYLKRDNPVHVTNLKESVTNIYEIY